MDNDWPPGVPESFQLDPPPVPSRWWFRWCFVGATAILGVIWWL